MHRSKIAVTYVNRFKTRRLNEHVRAFMQQVAVAIIHAGVKRAQSQRGACRVLHNYSARHIKGAIACAVGNAVGYDVYPNGTRINNVAANNDGRRQVTLTHVRSRRASVRIRITAFNRFRIAAQ